MGRATSAILLVVCVFKSITSIAQLEVSGKVIDDNNVPLHGVNIVVAGTVWGTITNPDGEFSLKIPFDSAALVFSFIGYETRAVKVHENKSIEVKLREEVITNETWNLDRGTKPLSQRKNRKGIVTVYARDKILIENNATGGKVVVWQLGNYEVFLPFDSLYNFLEFEAYKIYDKEFGINYLKNNSKLDTVFLSKEFVEKVGEGRLAGLAIKMIKVKSIVITNKNNTVITHLIVRDIMWVGNKRCGNCCWGGIEFLVRENESSLFTITGIIC